MTTQQDRAELSLVHASCTKAFHEPDGERVELMAWLNAEADKWDYFGNKAVAKVLREAAALLAADARGGEVVAYIINSTENPSKYGQLVHAHNIGSYQRPALTRQPLYTHPQPERVPLTDEQIIEGVQSIGIHTWGPRGEDFEAGVRYAEAAHHIGKPAPVGQLEDCHGVVAGKDQG